MNKKTLMLFAKLSTLEARNFIVNLKTYKENSS